MAGARTTEATTLQLKRGKNKKKRQNSSNYQEGKYSMEGENFIGN